MFPQCVKSAADKQYKQDSTNMSINKIQMVDSNLEYADVPKPCLRFESHKKMETWVTNIFSSRSLIKSKIYIKTRENATSCGLRYVR
jgi:hypothetical protein